MMRRFGGDTAVDPGTGGFVPPAPSYDPRIRRPRNRYAPVNPATDGPRRPGGRLPAPAPVNNNPWTNPGAGRQMDSFGSGDPAAGAFKNPNPVGIPMPPTIYPVRDGGWGRGPVTPNGMPGPTKYNVKYGPWGNKIQESYDGGDMPTGKDGNPLQYGGNFQKMLAEKYGGSQAAQFDPYAYQPMDNYEGFNGGGFSPWDTPMYDSNAMDSQMYYGSGGGK